MKIWNQNEKARLVDRLRQAIMAGIMVLKERDGLPVTAEMARERANNILVAVMDEIEEIS
jgi:hypothetical protein